MRSSPCTTRCTVWAYRLRTISKLTAVVDGHLIIQPKIQAILVTGPIQTTTLGKTTCAVRYLLNLLVGYDRWPGFILDLPTLSP